MLHQAASSRRVRLTSVSVQRLDGPAASALLTSLAQAEMALREWARTAPEDGHGYHRVAYVLAFDDGQEYTDIYPLRRKDAESFAIAGQIRERFLGQQVQAPLGRGRKGALSRPILVAGRRQQAVLQKRAAALVDWYDLG